MMALQDCQAFLVKWGPEGSLVQEALLVSQDLLASQVLKAALAPRAMRVPLDPQALLACLEIRDQWDHQVLLVPLDLQGHLDPGVSLACQVCQVLMGLLVIQETQARLETRA